MVGLFDDLFFKEKRDYVGFLWICTLDSIHLKKERKGGRTKGITIGEILKSAREQF